VKWVEKSRGNEIEEKKDKWSYNRWVELQEEDTCRKGRKDCKEKERKCGMKGKRKGRSEDRKGLVRKLHEKRKQPYLKESKKTKGKKVRH